MKDFVWKFLNWLKGSADNQPGGASSKKLTAFWMLVIIVTPIELCWLVSACIHNDWSYLGEVLIIDLSFVATALGINAVEKIKGKNTVALDQPQT